MTTTPSVPGDCTPTPVDGANYRDWHRPGERCDRERQEVFNVTCTSPSTHTLDAIMTVATTATLPDPHATTQTPGNNGPMDAATDSINIIANITRRTLNVTTTTVARRQRVDFTGTSVQRHVSGGVVQRRSGYDNRGYDSWTSRAAPRLSKLRTARRSNR